MSLRGCAPVALVAGVLFISPTSILSQTAQDQSAAKAEISKALIEASTLSQRAVELYNEGKYKDAVSPAKRALELREETLGKEHVLVGRALANLASVYYALRDYDDAGSCYERALRIYEKTFGPTSPDLCDVLDGLGRTSFAHSDNKRAESLFLRSMEIRKSSFGDSSVEAARSATVLAGFYETTGAHGKSADLYNYAIEIYEKASALPPDQLANLMGRCMCALVESGRPDEASKMESARIRWTDTSRENVHDIKMTGPALQGRALKRVEPMYPTEAKRAHITGTVIVQITIGEDGNVQNAVGVCGPELLVPAALEAARSWRFQPTTLSGVAVKVIGTITFHFKM